MLKTYAIALLGGTPTKAAKAYGKTLQAICAWKPEISSAQEAQVLMAFSKLPLKDRKANQLKANEL